MSLAELRSTFDEVSKTIDGVEWKYIDTSGARPVIIMLPGAQGTEEMFFGQILGLRDHARLISVWYPAIAEAAELADGLAHLLDALGAGQVNLLGSSFGGYVAQIFASKHPDKVRALVVANSFVDPGPAQAKGRPADEVRALPAEDVQGGMLSRIKDQPDSPLKDLLLDQMESRQDAENLKARVLGIALASPVPELPLTADQVTVIDCEDDPIISPEMREAVRERYAASTIHTLPSGGHYPYVLNADRYNQILKEQLLD